MSNINTTLNTTATAQFNKTFYDKKLLETAKTRLVHATFGQKRGVPAHNGKRVEFRRYELCTPDTDKLTLEEGITPDGQSLSQTHLEAEVKQYGAYIEISDLLGTTAFDNVINDGAELLGEQLGTVIEWVTRDAMCAGSNVQFANGKQNRMQLTADDKLTVSEIRRAVRSLKKAKARMFTTAHDGSARKPHFVCICSPDATFDLQNDPLWQDISKYANAEQIYSGEIGRLFGVVFVESTEAKVFAQSVYTTVAAHTANTDTVTLAQMTDTAAAYLSNGAKIKIGTNEYTVLACDKTAKTVQLSEPVATAIAAGTQVYSEDGGAMDSDNKALDIHGTLVFGADAYGVIDIAGGSALRTIIKPCGSAGAADPLDQRSTVGAKVDAYAATILNNLWIVRIEHAVSL